MTSCPSVLATARADHLTTGAITDPAAFDQVVVERSHGYLAAPTAPAEPVSAGAVAQRPPQATATAWIRQHAPAGADGPTWAMDPREQLPLMLRDWAQTRNVPAADQETLVAMLGHDYLAHGTAPCPAVRNVPLGPGRRPGPR
jgi:hypothetical protein